MTSLKVVEIGTPNLADIPAMLRRNADLIESGEAPRPIGAVLVTENEDGTIGLYGFGHPPKDVKGLVGLLEMAKIGAATE